MVTVNCAVLFVVSGKTISWSYSVQFLHTNMMPACCLNDSGRASFLYIPVTKVATRIVATDDTKGKFTVVESVSQGNNFC